MTGSRPIPPECAIAASQTAGYPNPIGCMSILLRRHHYRRHRRLGSGKPAVGVHLMVEVLDNPLPGLTDRDRLLLLAIAENASDDTREGWPGWQLLTLRMGWSHHKDGGRSTLKAALRDLAGRGVDVRVPLGNDRNGAPIYAVRGHKSTYRLPDLTEDRRGDSDPLSALKVVAQRPPMDEIGGHDPTRKGVMIRSVRGSPSDPPSPQGTLKENPHARTRASGPTRRPSGPGRQPPKITPARVPVVIPAFIPPRPERCIRHPDQPAHNCANCRSERIAAKQ
jgi:hypothetical protein